MLATKPGAGSPRGGKKACYCPPLRMWRCCLFLAMTTTALIPFSPFFLTEYHHHDTNRPVVPSSHSKTSSTAACLLILDDNPYLIEWLAYHYTQASLRRLIVAQDPHSTTTRQTKRILNQWNAFVPGLHISHWDTPEPYYLSETLQARFVQQQQNISADQLQVRLHRFRQRMFMTECLKKLHDEGREWTLLVDVDEFLFVNGYFRESRNMWPLDWLWKADQAHTKRTISDILGNYYPPETSCIMIPRLLIGPIPENTEKAFSFLTTTYKTSGDRQDFRLNGPCKSVLNVNKIPRHDLLASQVDPHRALRSHCPKGAKMWIPNSDSPLVLHHYVGPFDLWMRRSQKDPRQRAFGHHIKNRSRYNAYFESLNTNRNDDTLQNDWLTNFAQKVGNKTSMVMLSGVQKPMEDD